jgi:hypothetical protein
VPVAARLTETDSGSHHSPDSYLAAVTDFTEIVSPLAVSVTLACFQASVLICPASLDPRCRGYTPCRRHSRFGPPPANSRVVGDAEVLWELFSA